MVDINKTTTVALKNSDPRLTGNIKIVIGSNEKVYLSSIPSNDFIAKNIYNKFKVDSEFNFNYALNQFLTQEPITNLDFLYKTSDETLFQSGCRLNTNDKFTEKFRFFAPLYIHPLKGKPDYFIIFRKDNIEWNKGSIAAIFDLNKGEIGKLFNLDYIKNLPTEVWYKEAGSTNYYYFNGIAYKYAILGKEFKILSEDWDLSIFETINLLSGNHFNFEFMFNDNTDNPEFYIGKYFFKDKLFSPIELNLNIEMQNTLLNYAIDENNLYDLDNTKFVLSDDNNYFYIYNNITIPKATKNNLYLLEDKQKRAYIIDEINSNIVKLNSNILYFNDLFGVTTEGFKKVFCSLLEPGSKSIELKLNRDIEHNLFNVSDYLELDLLGFDNFKYRVIASNQNCCNSTNIGFNGGNTYFFQSDFVSVENYHNINIIKVKCNDLNIPIEVNAPLIVSCNLFKNKILHVDYITYNYDSEYFEMIFIDNDGLFFDINNIGALLFKYTVKPYFYTYFDPFGAPAIISRRIVEAFRKFNTKLFDFTYINNAIIIKTKYKGNTFEKVFLNINTGHTNTPMTNFIVNGKTLTGTKFYDNTGKLIIHKKFASCELNGASEKYGSRLKVSKKWVDNNLTGYEVFSCKQGLKKLKKYKIDEIDNNFKSIYIDEPILGSNYIKNYNDIDNYYVLSVDNDSFNLTEGGYINCYNIFRPKILKLITLDSENI